VQSRAQQVGKENRNIAAAENFHDLSFLPCRVSLSDIPRILWVREARHLAFSLPCQIVIVPDERRQQPKRAYLQPVLQLLLALISIQQREGGDVSSRIITINKLLVSSLATIPDRWVPETDSGGKGDEENAGKFDDFSPGRGSGIDGTFKKGSGFARPEDSPEGEIFAVPDPRLDFANRGAFADPTFSVSQWRDPEAPGRVSV